MYQFNSCVVLSRILHPLHPWYLQESYTVKSNPNSPVNFCEVLLWLLDTQEWCGHQMRNESENCGHGRESNPTSSAIAAAALTSELQAIPMAYWHNCSSNLSLFSKFLNLMTILSYFIPWIFYISDYYLKRISPSIEHITISKFWCWSSPVGRLANHPDDVFIIFSGCLSTSRTRLRSQKCNENNTTWHEKLQSHPFFVKYTISIYAQ